MSTRFFAILDCEWRTDHAKISKQAIPLTQAFSRQLVLCVIYDGTPVFQQQTNSSDSVAYNNYKQN